MASIPREPRKGQSLDANWGAQMVQAVRAMVPRGGPGVRVNTLPSGTTYKTKVRRGGISVVASDALTLTYIAPPGWIRPDGETRIPVFVAWGVANSVIPDNIDSTAFYLPTDPVDGTTYVYMKCFLSDVNSMAVTSATIVTGTNPADFATPAFGDDGSAPEYCFVPLGRIVSASGAITLQSAGKGSLIVTISTADFGCSGDDASFTRQLVWWRSNN